MREGEEVTMVERPNAGAIHKLVDTSSILASKPKVALVDLIDSEDDENDHFEDVFDPREWCEAFSFFLEPWGALGQEGELLYSVGTDIFVLVQSITPH